MSDLRVLHVVESLTAGAARHVGDLVAGVEGVEHHVAVPATAARHRPDDALIRSRLEALGGHLHPIEMRRPPVDPRNGLALWRLRRLARAVDPDVVHAHSSIAGALARVALAAGRRPVVYTPHGLQSGRGALAIERLLRPLTTRLVAVSASEGDDVRRLRLVPPERLAIIPNGIPSDEPEPRSLHEVVGLEPDVLLVGTVGRLATEKAPEVFVATAAAVAAVRPDVHFVLVGDGPLTPLVDGAIAAAGLLDRFHRVQHLAEAARYVPSLAVFVMTSRSEAGPYAPLEAMRAGTPVVVTDVRGCRDTVEDGVTGLVVPPEDPAAAGAAVLALLDDPSLAQSLVARAREVLRERFDVRVMADAHRALYDAVTRH